VSQVKARSLAKATKSGGASLLGYPDMVKIALSPETNDGHGLYEFKTCVVEKVSVSYSQDGVPVWFKGTNLPAFISLNISLKEIEMVLNETDGYTTFNALGVDISNLVGEFTNAFDRSNKATLAENANTGG
jgi:hypothetical protein